MARVMATGAGASNVGDDDDDDDDDADVDDIAHHQHPRPRPDHPCCHQFRHDTQDKTEQSSGTLGQAAGRAQPWVS